MSPRLQRISSLGFLLEPFDFQIRGHFLNISDVERGSSSGRKTRQQKKADNKTRSEHTELLAPSRFIPQLFKQDSQQILKER
jgi:hypothetical protein